MPAALDLLHVATPVLPAHEQAVVQRAAAFARDVIEPAAARWEQEGGRTAPREIVAAAAATGLCGLRAPREVGGEALSATATARVFEELAYADLGAAFVLVVHNNAVGIIARWGDQAQQQRYLGDLIAGRKVGGFLLTEPDGGSDAAALRTTATAIPAGQSGEAGRGWILNGSKAWITAASCADVLNTYAQTDPTAGWRGIAAFLVDADQPGVERVGPYPMAGTAALGAGGFRFHDCRLAADQLFVPAGEAFKVAMAGIDLARLLVAAMCSGMVRRGVEEAVTATQRRSAFGQRLADHQGLAWMIADAASTQFALRCTTYAALDLLDRGEPTASVAAAHAKKLATRGARTALADCLQTLGADGLRHDLGHPLARHLAAAKVAEFLDGTTEIQNVVISRALFGPPTGGRPALG